MTYISLNQWSSIPLGNTFTSWAVFFLTVAAVLWLKRTNFHPQNKSDYRIVAIYFLWMLIGVVRGIVVADNYWEYKQLVNGTLALSLPVFVYVFSSTKITGAVLKYWVKFAIIPFILFFAWVAGISIYHFYLGPVFLFGCFLPLIKSRWKYVFLILLLIMLVGDVQARSQMIKAAVSLLCCASLLLRRWVCRRKIIRAAHFVCYVAPVVLLFLGITDRYNVFTGVFGEDKQLFISEDEETMTAANADTRTFIYI